MFHLLKALFVLIVGLLSALALTSSDEVDSSIALEGYSVSVDDSSIEIFADDKYSLDDDLEEGDFSEMHRSLLATTTKCKPKASKKCRKPSKKKPSPPPPKKRRPPPPKKRPSPPPPKKRPSPPPPKRRPPPPRPVPEPAYEDANYEVIISPSPKPSPPPPVVQGPPPPPRENMCRYSIRRKVLSGPRLVPNGGLRACTGLHVSGPSACCQICQGTTGCNGWMYTRPLDCRSFGSTAPENVCYMLSDVTGSYEPILGSMDYASGTAFY
jgi:hypothetical protein